VPFLTEEVWHLLAVYAPERGLEQPAAAAESVPATGSTTGDATVGVPTGIGTGGGAIPAAATGTSSCAARLYATCGNVGAEIALEGRVDGVTYVTVGAA
jgi:hypothetical protein